MKRANGSKVSADKGRPPVTQTSQVEKSFGWVRRICYQGFLASELCLSLCGLTNLASLGCFPLESWRSLTTHPAVHICIHSCSQGRSLSLSCSLSFSLSLALSLSLAPPPPTTPIPLLQLPFRPHLSRVTNISWQLTDYACNRLSTHRLGAGHAPAIHDRSHIERSLLTTYWSESTNLSRPALRHGSLNSLFQVAVYLRS